MDADDQPPSVHINAALQAVLVASEQPPDDAEVIRGHDFDEGRDLDSLMESMLRTGLQASALGQAIREVNRMVSCRGCTGNS